MSGASTALQSFETSFHQDLNGDGTIGVPVTGTVIESAGSTSLVQWGATFFLDGISTGSGPLAQNWRRRRGGRSVWWLDADWRRADGERLSGGLENPGRRSIYCLEHRQQRQLDLMQTAFMSGASTALQSFETSFHQDLNGDGTIGVPVTGTVIESAGSTSLVQWSATFFPR